MFLRFGLFDFLLFRITRAYPRPKTGLRHPRTPKPVQQLDPPTRVMYRARDGPTRKPPYLAGAFIFIGFLVWTGASATYGGCYNKGVL